MATALLTHTVSARTPSSDQRRQAALTIRSIGRLAPRPSRARYACASCSTAWSGPEADCWNCGLPATHSSNDASLLHLLLMSPVIVGAPKAGTR
ncbi:hypothetical protein [Kitasatospora sp. NBC_01302]|uniref:hypothetical protein n=1 Tax=Kitasatospora sp. NBC_01302 TaxID=2903575 RepID=UPI002E11BD5D|nr:hypothetical protein OG294_40140 [Kitasatospora sp. NBC_01302]